MNKIIKGDIEKKNPNRVIFRMKVINYNNGLTVLGAIQNGSLSTIA